MRRKKPKPAQSPVPQDLREQHGKGTSFQTDAYLYNLKA